MAFDPNAIIAAMQTGGLPGVNPQSAPPTLMTPGGPPPENEPKRAISLPEEDVPELCNLWRDNVSQAETDSATYYSAVDRARRIMSGKDDSKLYDAQEGWEKPCLIVDNFCARAKATLAGNVGSQLLPEPNFFGVEIEDVVPPGGKSRKYYQTLLERYYQQLLEEPTVAFKPTIESMLDTVYTDGVAFAAVPWLREERMRTSWTFTRDIAHDPATMEAIGEPEEKWTRKRALEVVADTPTIVPLTCCDGDKQAIIGTFPASNGDLQRSTATFIRWEMTGDACLQHAHNGFFDKAAVNALMEKIVDEARRSPEDRTRSIANSVPPDRFFASRRFVVTEYQTLYAREEGKLPEEWRFFFSETWQIMLHANPSPWFSGLRNVWSLRAFPDRSGLFAPSLADTEVAGDTQIAMTNVIRLLVNRGKLMIDPEIAVPRGTPQDDLDMLVQKRGPGALVELYEDTIKKLTPLDVGGNPGFLIQLYRMLEEQGEMATGMASTRSAALTRGQTTNLQRELEAMELSTGISKQLSRLSNGLMDFGALLKGLVYQYQGRKSMQRIWRKANPESGETDMETALGMQHLLVPASHTEPGSPQQKQSRDGQIFATAIQDPLVMRNPKSRYYVMSKHYSAMGESQPENILGTEEEYTAAMMADGKQQELEMLRQQAMEQLKAGGMGEGSPPGAPGGMPPLPPGAAVGNGQAVPSQAGIGGM